MGSSPSPPPPPDPTEIARTEAQFNRIDTQTPLGSLTYSGPNNTNANLTFSPEVQQLVNQRIASDQGLLSEALGRLPQLESQPIDLSQFGPIQSQIDTSNINFTGPQVGDVPSLNAPELQGQVGTPTLQRSVDLGLDTGNLPGIPQDINAYRNDAERAVFERGRALLDPVFSDRERALEQRLANQGLPTSGEAYDRDVTRFQREQNRAYGDLANQAVLTGGREASRQLGDVLAARGQGFGEQVTGANLNLAGGQFANQAGLNQLGADIQAGNFANQAGLLGLGAQQGIRGQLTDEALALNQAGNQASAQNLGLQQQLLQNQNAARAQALSEAQGIRGNQFNEMASLLGLQQVQPPQVGNFFQPGQANVTGAYGLNQQAQQNAYNANAGQNAAMLGGLFDLGGAFVGGPAGGAALSNWFPNVFG